MSDSLEELIDKRKRFIESSKDILFFNELKRLLTDLYPDNAHFIYELLQNAEDAQANEVRFVLHDDYMEFEHNGKRLFNLQDINAITSIGSSTKRDDCTKIGKFGVGFKAIFAYTDSPEIYSGEYAFCIRDMIVPELMVNTNRAHQQNDLKLAGVTKFYIPFNNAKKPPQKARLEIEKLLKALNETTILFLTHICKIEYLLPDATLGYIERISSGNTRYEIRVQRPSEFKPVSAYFLRFDKIVDVEDDEANKGDEKLKTCCVSVAFGLNRIEQKNDKKNSNLNENDPIDKWEIIPMERGHVCIYFLAEKETSNLKFHIHAPFASTVARDSVRDCQGNKILRDHIADLVAESMHIIRDLGLLTVRTLAVLPNYQDSFPEFYDPLHLRLISEFQKEKLTPMKQGGYADAHGVFMGSKAISELINDEDLITLLGVGDFKPMWVANPNQRHQREYLFLTSLKIKDWAIDDLVKSLVENSDDVKIKLMGPKTPSWHQRLYAMINDDYLAKLNKYEIMDTVKKISTLKIILTTDGNYMAGSNCYFLSEANDFDVNMLGVNSEIFTSGENEKEKSSARSFLVAIGVREVNDATQVEAILKNKYTDGESFSPEIKNISRFIRLVNDDPSKASVFKDYRIFKRSDEKWAKPSQVCLDAPFEATGLAGYYEMFKEQAPCYPLNMAYSKCGISMDDIANFSRQVEVKTFLEIEKIYISMRHPEWNDLQHGDDGKPGKGADVDFYINKLKDYFFTPQVKKSLLLWNSLVKAANIKKNFAGYPCDEFSNYCTAQYGCNKSNIVSAKSTLLHDLITIKWVPQNINNELVFVQPKDACSDNLPEGFLYDKGWKWLGSINFGETIKNRSEKEKREEALKSQEFLRQEQTIKELGFESSEQAKEFAQFAKENPSVLMSWKNSKKISTAFPTNPVHNPQRRQDKNEEAYRLAPDKSYEARERSVRTTANTIDPTVYLLNNYTNNENQMICQICKDVMPFKKRDGTYYFEKKELLSKEHLQKEHEAQHIALCPLCAAKYQEFIKGSPEAMDKLKLQMLQSNESEIPIKLGTEITSIRFVETHFHDLQTILKQSTPQPTQP